MAMTYDELKEYLKTMEFGYQEQKSDAGHVRCLAAQFMCGEDDEKPEVVFIKLHENGRFLSLSEPIRYSLNGCQHVNEVLQTLLKINYENKMIKWGIDSSDGEIRASIECSIEDGTLTLDQFSRALKALVNTMDQSHDRITNVMKTGQDSGPVNSTAQRMTTV
ncbi:MAG: hypothetical protein R8K22_06800 [Mariprofundaceae bacterium]